MRVSTPADARHLTLSTLDRLWHNHVPIELPVTGEPACRLQLDPPNRTATLVTMYNPPEPNIARLKNVSFETWSTGEEEFAGITVAVEGNIHGAYGLLASIADELQLSGAPLSVALANSVGRYRDVVANRVALNVNREVGLFGEVLFLSYLIHEVGAEPGVTAWMGPVSEEHDFVFDDIHVEVKTTSSERRNHMINGLSQLVPIRGTPLAIVSIQITRAAHRTGQTLAQLIASVRVSAGGYAEVLNRRLESAGWFDEDSDLYPTAWTLRTDPRAYWVEGDFPALTPDGVAHVVPHAALVNAVSYSIDLTDFPHIQLPAPYSGFVIKKE